MTYRKILDGSDQTVVESSSAADVNSRPSGDLAGGARSSLGISGRDDSVDDEMHHYTRVQILAQLLLSANERQGPFSPSIDFSDADFPGLITDFDFPNSPFESFAEPSDSPTKYPAPEPRGGGGRAKYSACWMCHECQTVNSGALSPDRCCVCSHYRCHYCHSCG